MHLFFTIRRVSSFLLLAFFLGSATAANAQVALRLAEDVPEREAFIDSLLARMTIEEKLGQLAQYTGEFAQTGPRVRQEHVPLLKAGEIGSFLNIYGAETTCRFQRIAVEESRLGIPVLFAHDVVHGFRTIFPIPLAMAGSFDPEGLRRASRIAAMEASSAGVHWTFAPMIDIARNARWGRVMEGFGEDPYLASVMTRAAVQGFQGDDLSDPNTLMATAKHFVAYGAALAGRDYNTVDISRRTLREIYLPPFHAAVEAGVASIMAAFNEVNGIPMHAHGRLINEVLREEWGWEGLLVSDYTGVLELIKHGVAANRMEAGLLALRAGVDVDMVSGIYGQILPEAVHDGRLSEEIVDQAVRRVLRAKYEVGLFEDPYRYCSEAPGESAFVTDEYREAALEMARKSIVLLKNQGDVLPLSKNLGTLAVIGPLADDARQTLADWKAAGRAEDAVSILAGIHEAVGDRMEVRYAAGLPSVSSTDASGFAEAVALADEADAVVLVLGEHYLMSAEASSRAWIDLPGIQLQLAEAVMATGAPVAAVLMNGRPMAVSRLDALVPAILETWYLGVEMGDAVADVLFGDYNPGGSLPVTFPYAVGQTPIFYNHKPTGRPPDPDLEYTSKYLDIPFTPLYPFGHGLSYTTFAYDNLQLSDSTMRATGTLTVTVDVTNTGDRAGDEVVQLYIRDLVASVTRPVKELRGFERIHLEPGETETVAFTLEAEDLAFWGRELRQIVEPGRFDVFVGGSSKDVVESSFQFVGETLVL